MEPDFRKDKEKDLTEELFKIHFPVLAEKMKIGSIESLHFNLEPYTVMRTIKGFIVKNIC